MSGGSHNYAYRGAEDMARELTGSVDPLRRAFAEHLLLVSEAMHAIEWVDSCDWGPEDERAPILAVLQHAEALAAAAALRKALEDARVMLDTFKEAKHERP